MFLAAQCVISFNVLSIVIAVSSNVLCIGALLLLIIIVGAAFLGGIDVNSGFGSHDKLNPDSDSETLSGVAMHQKKYQTLLLDVEKNPNDPKLRRKLLLEGRHLIAASVLTSEMMEQDIEAATAGATIGIGNVRQVRVNTGTITDEINGLAKLFHAGVISADEFEIGKTNLLGNKTDKVDEKARNLAMLYRLKKQNVITEGEFNIKKWDILSRK